MTQTTSSGASDLRSALPSLARKLPVWTLAACAGIWGLILAILLVLQPHLHMASLASIGVLGLLVSWVLFRVVTRSLAELHSEFDFLTAVVSEDNMAAQGEAKYTETGDLARAIRTSRRQYRDEIETLQRTAFRDAVTGLPNRLSLQSFLERQLPGASFGEPAALFHIRLDEVSRAKDRLGAALDDTVYQEISTMLSMFLAAREADPSSPLHDTFLAALAPGEFGIFLPSGCGRQEASELARDLRILFAQSFEVASRSVTANVSGGIAMAPDDGDMAGTLLKNASMALEEILRAGQGGFQFFTPRLERLAVGRLRFEEELRRAVANEAFKPVFQPKISFRDGRIVGVEALARWYRGEDRTISPGTFIPLAEELGLVDEIGYQILRASCRAAASWMELGHPISVAVNVAPSQFHQKDFIDQVVDALRFAGLPPRLLELEITETMAVSDPQRVTDVMQPLRAMGIKLAIDDFGTGHANLSMLTQLPFDIFKIDRQFVSALEEDAQAPAIVEMILAMAETLGLTTVAEGVETEAQAAFLRRRGCTMGQGFLFSRGIPDEDFQKLLINWQKLDAAS